MLFTQFCRTVRLIPAPFMVLSKIFRCMLHVFVEQKQTRKKRRRKLIIYPSNFHALCNIECHKQQSSSGDDMIKSTDENRIFYSENRIIVVKSTITALMEFKPGVRPETDGTVLYLCEWQHRAYSLSTYQRPLLLSRLYFRISSSIFILLLRRHA